VIVLRRWVRLTRAMAGLWLLAAAACVSVNKSVLAPNPTGRTFGEQDVYVYFQDDSIPEHTRVAILNDKGDSAVTRRERHDRQAP
jgi:uncharacterized protein YaiI (UPF0178 family)